MAPRIVKMARVTKYSFIQFIMIASHFIPFEFKGLVTRLD